MIGRVEVTRRGVARAGLALAVAAVAVCVVYFGGRALGLGGDAPALGQGGDPPGQGDSLALTISVPEVCETGQEDPGYGSVWDYDDDGNWVRTGSYGPFYQMADISTAELEWSISGGTAPYEVSVQGQTLLTGPTGSTLVYCAESLPYDELDFTQSRDEYERTELDDHPVVNPGPMTFEATVQDAGGLSATATADTYIIPDCDIECKYDVYPTGHTFRIQGRLITIPAGLRISAQSFGYFSDACEEPSTISCQPKFGLELLDDDPHNNAVILIGLATGDYFGYLTPSGYWNPISDGSVAGSSAEEDAKHPLHDKFAQLGASIDRSPLDTGDDGTPRLAGEEEARR